jgi:uncharacterized membrane protein YbhN (UPF0104 family)
MPSRLILFAKIGIAGAIFALVLWRVDVGSVAARMQTVPLWLLGVIIPWIMVQMSLIAPLRALLLLGALGSTVPLRLLAKISWSGCFFEQAGFNVVGGDIARLLLLNASGVSKIVATEYLVIDRCIGIASLLALSLLGLHALLGTLPAAILAQVILWATVLTGVGITALVLLVILVTHRQLSHWRIVRMLRDSFRRMWGLTSAKWRLPAVIALALLTHLSNVVVFYAIGTALDIPLSFTEWLTLVPSALLLAMLPISIAGWGVREAAIIFALGTYGIDAAHAVVPSVVYGLCVLAASLPGGLIWMSIRRGVRPVATTESGPAPVFPLEQTSATKRAH